MESTLWTEKYRPESFSDIKGQKSIVKRVSAFVRLKNMPHQLYAGPAGVGKSSLALVVAKQLFSLEWKSNFLELNASNERGINVVRSKIKDFCKKKLTLPEGVHKIIFLDEVESMTLPAQQALRRIIELYAHNTRFCMACNSSSSIIEAIQSRCAIKKFLKIKDKCIFKRLAHICKLESIHFTDEGLNSIILNINGDMRKAIIILQTIATTYKKITTKTVNKIINKPKNNIITDINNPINSPENRKNKVFERTLVILSNLDSIPPISSKSPLTAFVINL